MSDYVKITVEAAGAAWWSADRALDRTVEKIQKIDAKIAAVQAEIGAGGKGMVKLLKRLNALTVDKLKATESHVAHHEVAKFASELLSFAREAEKERNKE